ncbi:unnamed protein product [Clonostachys rosea]|uniref:Nucleoside phosphorylase domain-containing protein n=1 Tax=Bionectria ochroleuca TaxID=29856 RepID=A0ABY6U659_BIOOC|nr:unnamed protein product [Clonostachys rosea]
MDIRLLLDDGNRAPSPLAKRQKTSYLPVGNALPHDCYTIAWICALHIEMAAARAMLDETHGDLPRCGNDSNSYCLGSIKNHNIVIACLPLDQYGTVNAANILANLKRSFPSVRRGLMVGIGGGAPSQADVRLGDVVVGTRVMQHDFGKIMPANEMERTAIPKVPEFSLRTAVSSLRAVHELRPSRIPLILQEKMKENIAYHRPNAPDRLFQSSYNHEPTAASCGDCDSSQLKGRKTRVSLDPIIHYGGIASGNQVIKDATTRDTISQQLNVICFEMEAAGLMDILPCLPIRGICDYSDSHKAKEWQRYAAASAAAYAREFLEALAADNEAKEPSFASPCAEQPVSSDRRKELLESLKFPQIDARKASLKSAHKKTCQWFLEHPDYLEWLDRSKVSRHHGFLWIRGKPGAGKSIIMKFLYSRMRKHDRPKQVLTASFFFNARGDALERTVSGMYRSLILQLLEGFPHLQRFLEDPEIVPRHQTGCPHLNVLKNLFLAAVSSLTDKQSFTCFIDALDECDEQQVKDMVDFFDELAEDCTRKRVSLQVCFSSRHYPYIDIRTGIRLTLEDQNGHADDLKAYIRSQLRIKNLSLMEELMTKLLEKAAGVFLWVALVVDILNKENQRGCLTLRKRLAEVPSDLGKLFKEILTRDQENMEELLLSILWILFAERPLRPEEYYHALWSGLSLQGLVDRKAPSVETSDADDCCERCVISSSKGLAEITMAKQPTVQFIHESVRDFLLKDNGLSDLWPDLGADFESQGHDRLKSCCHIYLCQEMVWKFFHEELRSESPMTLQTIPERFPFLEYASQCILFHANAAADVISQERFLDQFPVSYWKTSYNIFEKYKIRKYDETIDILYILADKDLPALIRARLKTNVNVGIRGGRFGSPLLAAMVKGSKDSVAALLGLSSTFCDGIDITKGLKADRMESVQKRHTPFTWAYERGCLSLARLVFRNGLHMDDDNQQSSRSLLEPSETGDVKAVEWLLDVGVDLEIRGYQGPLSCAAGSGHAAIVQLLVEKGANVDPRDGPFRGTPLTFAAGRGHTAVVQLLVENGADVNSVGMLNWTPLSRAAEEGHVAVVQLLVEKGANIESTDIHGQTPLLGAAERGHTAVVQLLVEKGANIESTDIRGQTPLLGAAERGYTAVVQLLVEKGANIESKDAQGGTPLLGAAGKGNTAVVQLLVEEGAKIESTDRYGRTALFRAVERGDIAVVQLLLEKGAAVDVKDASGLTPLLVAASSQHTDAIRLLLQKGADIDMKDNEGQTSLSRAARNGTWILYGYCWRRGQLWIQKIMTAGHHSHGLPTIAMVILYGYYLRREQLWT